MLCSGSNDQVSLPLQEFQSLDLGLFCKGDWSIFAPVLLSLFIFFSNSEAACSMLLENRASDEQHLSLCGSKVLISFREQAGFSWAPGWLTCDILWLPLQFHLDDPQ